MVRRAQSCAGLAEVRLKLEMAAEAGRQAPHKHIGVRMREAIGVLLAKKEPERVAQPMLRVEEFTAVSRDCCKVRPGVLPAAWSLCLVLPPLRRLRVARSASPSVRVVNAHLLA